MSAQSWNRREVLKIVSWRRSSEGMHALRLRRR